MRPATKLSSIRKLATAVLVAALLSCPAALVLQAPAAAQTYPDIAGQPAEIQQAIDYVSSKGYMNGGADGNFYPNDPVNRIDYACSVVKLFKKAGENPDPAIQFSDLPQTDPLFKYANLAVKHGYMSPYPDGTFKKAEPQSAASALAGLVQGLELGDQATFASNYWPSGPSYLGVSIVANDLHLKFRDTRIWPTMAYPRGEMAYSLQVAEQPDSWRVDYVKDNLDWMRCQRPLVGPEREKALEAAFSKVGYPYVWGGESDSEGGYDCSGLTYYVQQSVLGHPMMRVADDQAKDGRYAAVAMENLLPGDPVFFYKDPAQSDYVGHAGMYIGRGLFIHSTGSNAGVSVDRLADYYADHFAGGKRVIAEAEPESFDTYVLLANPGGTAAKADVTYMLRDSRQIKQEVSLDPYSRKTVRVDDTLVNEEVSTKVEATEGTVVAERSMYFRYHNAYPGGHVSAGTSEPASQWFLAEGCTAYGFDTYILVQNPNAEPSQVTLTFLKSGGQTQELVFQVAPLSRYTVPVDSVKGMEQVEFSTQVTSSKPVVVERSMYFDYDGIKEGSSAGGVTSLSGDWFFAEGYTGAGFDTFILLANPSDKVTHATLSLASDGGQRGDVYVELAPHSRKTIPVDGIKGWEQKAFSARVRADNLIAAERAMYFTYNGIPGGHDSFGSPALSDRWFLAEGYTAGSFDTYILVFNPNRLASDVSVRFLLRDGRFVDKVYRVAPESRYTIAVDKIKGLEAEEVSASITSTIPVVVERSMYFSYLGKSGGSCERGVTGPAALWYFAEGYTGR
ncbi:MAG: DUF5719 family protein [Candidatus Geothermincolia bacterium]